MSIDFVPTSLLVTVLEAYPWGSRAQHDLDARFVDVSLSHRPHNEKGDLLVSYALHEDLCEDCPNYY